MYIEHRLGPEHFLVAPRAVHAEQGLEDIAMLARAPQVDIAVDLKGFPADNRVGVFAYRAAPIQVGYLGAVYIDYIVADGILIPEASARAYLRKSLKIGNRLRPRPASPQTQIDGNLGLWESGLMKTTLEIPDALMQRVKLRAVRRNQKLKDAIAQLLEIGMAAAPDLEQPRGAPKPVRLKSRGQIDIRSIEAAIAAGRE